jgi:polar amino acid transport system substrate-binding protein
MRELALGRRLGTITIALLGLICAACASSPTPTSGSATSSPAATAVASTAPPNSTSSSAPVEQTTTAADLAAELITPGRVVICIAFPVPLVAVYDATGEPTGQSVEFALGLAQRLNLEPEVRDTTFEDIIDAVEAGDCDFSLAGHIITPERLKRIEMIPYLKGRFALVVRYGNPEGFEDSEDLCGMGVSSVAGSIQEEMVRGVGLYRDSGLNDACAEADLPPIDLVTFPGEAEAVAALRLGEVVAFLGGSTWLAEYPDELAIAPAVVLPDYNNGIGVRKDHPLLADALRSSLDAMIADGTYLRIHNTWGVGEPITQ